MALISFFIRYAPFWAVPLIFISAEFVYVYWLKDKKLVYRLFLIQLLFSIGVLAFYLWAGGPENANRKFYDIVNSLKLI